MTGTRPAVVTLLLASLLVSACGAPSEPALARDVPSSSSAAAAAVVAPAPIARGPERLVQVRPSARPAAPSIAVGYAAALVEDHCVDRDLPAPAATDVALTILDRSYALPAEYVPADLVPASMAGLSGSSGTKLLRSVVIEDLAAMRAAWEAAGLAIMVDSAYRSYSGQAATFERWAAMLGTDDALARSARPGHSEHQLGTAIDVSSPGWGGRFGDWAAESAEGAWMAAHAWEFGFVMSYPAGSQPATCFSYEPWHYRWIGREAAAAHRSSGLTLRAFLERHVDG